MEAKEKSKRHLNIRYKESVSGGYVGVINEIPGCISQGETIEELKVNLIDAMLALFEACKEDVSEALMSGENIKEAELQLD